jgi:arginyl-tRNA--protein-N-Asp/Glu arginylyltransferase
MKYIFLEEEYKYKEYKFPYKVYLEREEGDKTDQIFENGFLPTRIRNNLFYLCRSLRVNLKNFNLSSENRRILRKTEYLQIELKEMSNFEYHYTLGKKAMEFYRNRFGEKILSARKAKWIFNSGFFNGVLIFKDQKETVGHCPVMKTEKLIFYAYPFYNLAYLDKNIGMGMMTKTVNYAKENGYDYVYLGTVYTEESLYKMQFEGLEYSDGVKWSTDLDRVKEKIKKGENIKYKISEI